jgi:Zn finger protein HypA/HybF involved in hydrogenase expression
MVDPTFIPLNELDEADIKLDRCPSCKSPEPLKREDGYKFCPRCKSIYKMFDGQGYIVGK